MLSLVKQSTSNGYVSIPNRENMLRFHARKLCETRYVDDNTRQRLIDFALALEEFRDLHPKEQKWLRPLLSKNFESTLKILELITDQEMSFKAIAIELGLNPQTVTQKLNGLKAGGMNISITGYSAVAHTGRPRHLLRA